MLFAIDQQQYIQGYLPIVLLYALRDNLNTIANPVSDDRSWLRDRKRMRSRLSSSPLPALANTPLSERERPSRSGRPLSSHRSGVGRRGQPAGDSHRAREPTMSESRSRASLHRILVRPEMGALAGAIGVWIFFAVVAGDTGFTLPPRHCQLPRGCGPARHPGGRRLLLMIGGEFDLSIGSTIGACGMITGAAQRRVRVEYLAGDRGISRVRPHHRRLQRHTWCSRRGFLRSSSRLGRCS